MARIIVNLILVVGLFGTSCKKENLEPVHQAKKVTLLEKSDSDSVPPAKKGKGQPGGG